MSDQPRYNTFYHHIAHFPEIGRFRRYGGLWAKRVYDETSRFREKIEALNHELSKYDQLDSNDVLECPLHIVKQVCPKTDKQYKSLYKAWDAYDKALMRYGEVLCMSEQVMKLPTQDDFHAKSLQAFAPPNCKAIFDNEAFAPTGEQADYYSGNPRHTDTCAWRAIPRTDILTSVFVKLSPWIERNISGRFRKFAKGSKGSTECYPEVTTTTRLGDVVAAMDTLSCVLAPLLLACTITVLAVVRSFWGRVGIITAFGFLFALLLKLMAGSLGRAEVFGATAAFYAVAVVFVSSVDDCRVSI